MSSDRLTLSQIALLTAYALGMSGGQILFKQAAVHLNGIGIADRLLSLMHNFYFVSALVFYGALSLLYLWIPTFTRPARAYPFVPLAFALTPALVVWLFGEPVSFRLIVGIAVILCGLFLVIG